MQMISVRAMSKDDWAKYALLVIYAWDMCDLNQDPASNTLDPRILADGWTVVGIISGRDNVLATAPSARPGIPPQNAGLRQSTVRPGLDIRRYEYLAVNPAGDTYVAVIRGTDEWLDDVVFIAEQRSQFPGRVEGGFTDIYLSMEYRPLAGGATVPIADGIRAAVGAANVLVLGHSLGSALAECLAYQLAGANSLGAARVGAIMYASPKLGDHDFADAFDSLVTITPSSTLSTTSCRGFLRSISPTLICTGHSHTFMRSPMKPRSQASTLSTRRAVTI
jgi:triacylglycerol lipase